MWRAYLLTAFATGFRKCEMSTPASAEWHKGRLARSFLAWRVGGEDFKVLTPDQLCRLQPGDFAIVKTPVLKNDFCCRIFGAKPIYLPFRDNDPLNAAAALRDLELYSPVADADRPNVPLFASNGTDEILRHSTVDRTLAAHLRCVMPAAQAKHYSPHSFRIGLACALHALGKPPELIQAILRWAGKEAMSYYCRLEPDEYGDHVLKATEVEAASVTRNHIPRIDNDDMAVKFHKYHKSQPTTDEDDDPIANPDLDHPEDEASPGAPLQVDD